MSTGKTGILLINLGTPKGPSKRFVKEYLSEFLSDPRVIDLPWLWRKCIVNFLVLPFRPKESCKAYKQIWDDEKGSPLLFHTRSLSQGLQRLLGERYHVSFGMRYGTPSIASSVQALKKARCSKLIVLPLFPQYSSAATGSALESVLNTIQREMNFPDLVIKSAFYKNVDYVTVLGNKLKNYVEQYKPDRVLFSFHSLPVRQIKKSGEACAPTCFKEAPCQPIRTENQFCYRAQCYETASLVAQHAGLNDYKVTFQSRLGRTAWIGPDIQNVLENLSQEGVRKLMVICPSFVADCLETLEEIGLRSKAQWERLGGTEFTLLPSLNDDAAWIDALGRYIKSA